MKKIHISSCLYHPYVCVSFILGYNIHAHLQIAMKSNNEPLLHLIENIMRKCKPLHLTPNAAHSTQVSDGSESNTYQNCGVRNSSSTGAEGDHANSHSDRLSSTATEVCGFIYFYTSLYACSAEASNLQRLYSASQIVKSAKYSCTFSVRVRMIAAFIDFEVDS